MSEILKKCIELIKKYDSEFEYSDIVSLLAKIREMVKNFDILYRMEQPVISDTEFDEIYMALEELESLYPEYYDPNSPTQKITDPVIDELKKVKHTTFMGSQEKVKTEEGLRKFLNTIKGRAIVQHKLDGLTIVLRYENGKLSTAITRGDGIVGEDVTHTVLTISNVPKTIPYKDYLEVRMEAIIPTKEFEKINVDGAYSNARNLVSGTLRQLDASVARKRNIKGIVFDLVKCDKKIFKSDKEQLEFLNELGFETVNSVFFDEPEYESVVQYCLTFEEKERSSIPYTIDGLVIKADDLELREQMGYRSKSPRWSVAFKFKSQDATTYLRSVEWTVGRTGKITPVAIFDEVEIDGVNISRATLHNYGYIKERDLRTNDKIVVARMNDVIPSVVQSIKSERDKHPGKIIEITPPVYCPNCGNPLSEEGANLYCRNINCSSQTLNKIISFCDRDRMNIAALGKKTIIQLYEAGLIKSITDIYKLENKKDDFIKLEGLGKKKFEKIVASINESKKAALDKVLFGLSIPNIGETASKSLAKKFKNINNILKTAEDPKKFSDELLSIKDFGEETTKGVLQFFANKNNIEVIKELQELGLSMKAEETGETEPAEQKLKGLKFVITGTLSKERNYFKALIEKYGGEVSGSVSSKTNYLLVGENAGSKLDKAKQLGIKIINEEELYKLLN